ncbi:Solute carrier 2 (Facilitated glucose transporter) member 8 [Sticta canariensis]|nr:Solute carrier 2 (Facilitated glucose transporter) member 8 [Sticta canariensis]
MMEEKLKLFMEETELWDYKKYFRKGMFLAQHPQAHTDGKVQYLADELGLGPSISLKPTKREYTCLKRDEIDTTDEPRTWKTDKKKWRLPRPLWRLVTLCALGALIQGWDEAAVNSAQQFYQPAFKMYIENNDTSTIDALSSNIPGRPWLVGLVNSAPYLCCVLSCWLTQPLNAVFGRRGTIFIASLFSAAFAFTQAFSQSWQVLFAFRFLMGVGIGPKSATVPIYVAESAPENVRGGLVMMWQVFTAFGIMLGYLAGVALKGITPGLVDKPEHGPCPMPTLSSPMSTLLATRCSLNWRLILGSPMVAPVILARYIYTQPESPRWLIAKGHRYKRKENPEKATSCYRSAWVALVKLRHTKLQAARDMFVIYHLLEREQEVVGRDRKDRNIKWCQKGVVELFMIRRNWRALRASLICMFAQQFCGVNIFVYYSSHVLRVANTTNINLVLLLSMGFGFINFVFALPAFYTIDTLGRRSLLLMTFPFLALCHLIIAVGLLALDPSSQWKMVIAGMYLFGLFYSPGEGPVPFVYSAESMPLYIRDVGMGCVTSVNWLFNWLIAFTAPGFFVHFHNSGTFFWYAGWCVVLWFLIFLHVPETRILSLEQLDTVFNQTASSFRKFAWEDANWLFRRYIRRHKNMEDRPKFYEEIHMRPEREGTEMQSMCSRSTSIEESRP